MHKVLSAIDNFFFTKISATGFGLLRMAWGAVIFCWMLSMWQDVPLYYSNDGLVPPELFSLQFRNAYRFTLLNIITDPTSVWMLYILLLFASVMTCIGYVPRFFTVVTVLLFFSFQERNLLPLGGGDTVLRLVGFILAISPELRACSVHRLQEQWLHWKSTKSMLSPLTMSVWPYRLLLWQTLIIYVYSGLEKTTGSMWMDGTAVEVFFHHVNFFRWSKIVGDLLSPFSTFVSYFTLLFEFLWLILLVPKTLLERIPFLSYGSVKRCLLLYGFLFHLAIFLLSDVGIFPFAMLTLYFGLLTDDDFSAVRKKINRNWKGRIAILYDGKCSLCLRSVLALMQCDFLRRLHPINFHDVQARKKISPTLKRSELDAALHIVTPSKRTEKGFRAFRLLCWHLPLLWILLPFLYLPGSTSTGDRVYSWIAARRKPCIDGECTHL
jgi:predicted DCC family thiol-disulfide oxidoreductase YuxK